MYGVKETMCTTCSHGEVCSLKAEFLEAQKAVYDVYINCPCDDGKKIGIIHLREIKYIKPVELACIHYEKKNEGAIR